MGNANQTERIKDEYVGDDLGIAALRGWPVLFHGTHSPNVKLSHDRRRARRIDGIKGVCFSSRPICMGERVYIRIIEASNMRSGALHFGFTADDPCSINGEELPRYAYPDLTNEQGYWAKTVPEAHAQRGMTLFFYIVVGSGEVRFGCNGEELGVFFTGVQINTPLWALLDLYGSTTAVEFVDGEQIAPTGSHISISHQDPGVDLPYYMLPAVCPAGIRHANTCTSHSVPPPSFAHPPVDIIDPISFHPVSGRNVILSCDRFVATRLQDEYCNGYVFTHRPIRPGERLVVTVMATEREYVGGLAFGVTSCDPSRLRSSDLPDDADLLLDRPEYWVVHKDVCMKPDIGDELSFHLATSGEVRYSRNGHTVSTLMHVDTSLHLWIFLDIYGSTKELKSIGVVVTPLVRSQHVDVQCCHSFSATPPGIRSSTRPSSEPRLSIETLEGGRTGSRTLAMTRLSVDSTDTIPARHSPSPVVLHHCSTSNDNGHSSHAIVIRPSYDSSISSNKQSRISQSAGVPSKRTSSSSTPIDTPLELLPLPPPLIPVPAAGSSSVKEPPMRMKPSAAKPSTVLKPPTAIKPITYVARSPSHGSPQHLQLESQLPPASPLHTPSALQTPPPVPSRRSLSTTKDVAVSQFPPSSNAVSNSIDKKNVSQSVDTLPNECAVCLERAPDCVLYTCGHMCMCYQCAVDVINSRGALCPICRQPIRDVIKIYRS